MIIDPAIARRLLSTLELREEIGAKEISWALEIIRQIPGYKKVSIAQAAQDRTLKETLISIAREDIAPTSPKDLANLVEKAQKAEASQKAARQKGESDAKEFIQKTTSAKEAKGPKIPAAEVKAAPTPDISSTTAEPVLAVALTKIAGSKETAGFLQKVVFAPLKLVVEGTTPTRGGTTSAHISYAIVQGITPSKLLPLKSKALSLGLSEKQFETFVTALSKKKFLVSLSDAVNVGRELSISPSQVSGIFLRPSADKSSVSVFKKPLIDRVFGGLREALFGKPSMKGGGIAKQAEGAASSGVFSLARFLTGNAGRGSAPWGWAAAGGLAAGGLAVSGASPALAAGLFAGAAGTSLAAGANQVGGYEELVGEGAERTLASIGTLFTLAVSGLVTALVIGIIATIGTVAIFLFIINSGAYVVPPQEGSFQSFLESPYISVTKTVDPSGKVENSSLPVTVTYTVTIGAKKGDIILKSVDDLCTVSQKAGSKPCPEAEGFPNDGDFPSEISVSGGTYSFTYQRTFGPDAKDSLVHDTITVVADAAEQSGATAQASASFIIGTPPTGCFKVMGDNWPENYRANVESGIIAIVSKHPVFAAKVCSGGEVTIVYSSEVKDYWGYHNHQKERDVTLYSGGLTTALNAEYILTHEVSHHLQAIMPTLQSQYLDGALGSGLASERPLCSYSATSNPWEGFPEGNALYGSGKPLNSFGRCGSAGSFQSTYPNHWRFAKEVIFGE